MAYARDPILDLHDIQGDVLVGLQKNAENFIFFKIVEPGAFKAAIKEHVVSQVTTARRAHEREIEIQRRRMPGRRELMPLLGLAIGFTKDGMMALLGAGRPRLDPSFERGADHPDTILALNDPPKEAWLKEFRADRIDGVLMVTGPDRRSVTARSNELLRILSGSVKLVYQELASVRPGAARGHEHFDFLDGISQPGIRGLARRTDPSRRPQESLPGQDLLWPGEFVFGYPGQDPHDPLKQGPIGSLPAPWARNGSFMVFRRLEQKVPEFRRFAAERSARLRMDQELFAARLMGRWKSGAPLMLAPLYDRPGLGGDERRNNDFTFAGDPFERVCPYAAHIRKTNSRAQLPRAKAELQRHRIIRAGITFGPEVGADERTTAVSRGLMFICYQASIGRQFEFIQSNFANSPGTPGDPTEEGHGTAVASGLDPIIGQAPQRGPRRINFPSADGTPATLEMPEQFVVLTAAAYFFMPSISALLTVLT